MWAVKDASIANKLIKKFNIKFNKIIKHEKAQFHIE